MNKIVRPLYPIENLPKDLRVGLPEHGWVHIELNPVGDVPSSSLAELVGRARNVHGDVGTVLREIATSRLDR